MERELFRMVKAALRRLGRRRASRRFTYTDGVIVEVYYWSVINDRSVQWACRSENWPAGLRRGPLPSQAEMSRRLRTKSIRRLLARLEHLVIRRERPMPLVCVLDGKPLPIANHSRDHQAGYGRAVGGKSMGYKLHALVDLSGTVWGWRVAPMNVDERTIARRLLRDVPAPSYLLADSNYDSNALFTLAWERQIQMVVPRRYGPEHGVGHRAQHPARLRSRDMLENGVTRFGIELFEQRRAIERYFGTLTGTGGGLTCLPAWVRGHRRVRLWVQAKIIIHQLRSQRRQTLRAAA